jgi:hypothetical protein
MMSSWGGEVAGGDEQIRIDGMEAIMGTIWHHRDVQAQRCKRQVIGPCEEAHILIRQRAPINDCHRAAGMAKWSSAPSMIHSTNHLGSIRVSLRISRALHCILASYVARFRNLAGVHYRGTWSPMSLRWWFAGSSQSLGTSLSHGSDAPILPSQDTLERRHC